MISQLPFPLAPAIVLLHGLGHGGALIALAWIAARPGSDTGPWAAARSWLVPGLSPASAGLVAGLGMATCLVLFLTVALGMAGIGVVDAWRPVAVVAAVISLVGIGLFIGIWPAFNTVAAIVVNVAILAVLLANQ